jgi:hypothetical protein
MRWLTRHDFLVGAGAWSVMGKKTTLFTLGTPSQATTNVTSPMADP